MNELHTCSGDVTTDYLHPHLVRTRQDQSIRTNIRGGVVKTKSLPAGVLQLEYSQSGDMEVNYVGAASILSRNRIIVDAHNVFISKYFDELLTLATTDRH